MPTKLNTTQSDFIPAFKRFLALREAGEQQVGAVVTDIIKRVRNEGDKALLALTTQFDQVDVTLQELPLLLQQVNQQLASLGSS